MLKSKKFFIKLFGIQYCYLSVIKDDKIGRNSILFDKNLKVNWINNERKVILKKNCKKENALKILNELLERLNYTLLRK
jgi:hypothetical protein